MGGGDFVEATLHQSEKLFERKKLHEAFEATKSQILEISNFAKQEDIRFVLVLIPSLQTIEKRVFEYSFAYSVYNREDFELLKPYRLLEEFCKENDIEVINPVYAFQREYARGKKLFITNDMHFNKLGHEIFAQQIYAFLKQSKQATTVTGK